MALATLSTTRVERFYDPVTDTHVAFDSEAAAEVSHDGVVTVTPFTPDVTVDHIAVLLYADGPAR